MTINQDVIHWAAGRVDRQVASGECWDLANEALQQAGARSSTTTGANDDYVWGDAVELRDAIPGDVIQFRNHRVTITTTTSTRFPGGGGSDDESVETETRPHHTALLESAGAHGAVQILEQNGPGGRLVRRRTTYLRSSSPPPTITHRRVGGQNATITTTVRIQVSGRYWIYRPVAR